MDPIPARVGRDIRHNTHLPASVGNFRLEIQDNRSVKSSLTINGGRMKLKTCLNLLGVVLLVSGCATSAPETTTTTTRQTTISAVPGASQPSMSTTHADAGIGNEHGGAEVRNW